MDVFTKQVRSRIMSSIHGKDTKPEIILRKRLFKLGFRYSLKYRFKDIKCTPDLVLVSKEVCIFIDGCFWHKCPKCYSAPKSNKGYWIPKLEENYYRDRRQDAYLKKHGWKVIRIWEHEVNKSLEKTVAKLNRTIGHQNSPRSKYLKTRPPKPV